MTGPVRSVSSALAALFQPSPHEVAVPVRQALVRHPVDPALDGLDLANLAVDVGRHAANQWAQILPKPPHEVHVLLVAPPRVARAELLEGLGAYEFVR